MDFNKCEEFLKSLVDAGLAGIEVYNPNNKPVNREFYLEMCEKYDLIPTVGSDYHGKTKGKDIEIGKGKNNNLLVSDYSIVERIKEKKNSIEKTNS